jgi:hypothetical protein
MRAPLASATLAVAVAGCGDAASPLSDAGTSSATGSSVGASASAASSASAGAANRPPEIATPGAQQIAEREDLNLDLEILDPDGDPLRVFVRGLPPGARWDEPRRRLEFTPDFIQGGQQWTVTIVADDGQARAEASFTIEALDTIQPPAPTIAAEEPGDGFTRLRLRQRTDDFLDSPGYAGREFDAIVTAPTDASASDRRPVRVVLHGFVGAPWEEGWSGEYRVAPHDPMNSYWWGYAESLPDAAPAGAVREYTARRVLHLLEWVLREHPGADPERVYLDGASMGGAGALTIGLLHGRHFAWVSATIAQAIPRNHRPSRIAQLSSYWGDPGLDLGDGDGEAVWDRMDLTRALLEETEARDQLLFLKHGKDDPLIHFGAVVQASPLTERSLYAALQERAVGHLAVWDEGGHGDLDPVLGDTWWQTGWNPIFDDTSAARRDLAFPAFSRSTLDRDPGDGGGNGNQPWDPESGYAGDIATPGDSGWSGELAGALGRGLRWRSDAIVDALDRFEVPLRALDGDGGPPPVPGYPTTGDRVDGELPAIVDVTLRRAQAFRAAPGERLAWRFGALEGEVMADSRGDVTIPDLPLDVAWTTLEIWRTDALVSD